MRRSSTIVSNITNKIVNTNFSHISITSSIIHLPLLLISYRYFNVIQRGNDREVQSLFERLGFGKDNEAHRVRRTSEEIRQGFLSEAMKLSDPENNEEDKKKFNQLKEAYSLLINDSFRERYAAHHYASPDATLHLLVDGGQVAANFNPEHQSFEFVEHAFASCTSSNSNSKSSSNVQRSLGDFTGSFKSATGMRESPSEARAYDPRESRIPQNGASINFMLRISFDESILGCTKTAVYEKNISCSSCGGKGRKIFKKPRKCPQCRGRGSTHLPSATYHIEKTCSFCFGEGTAPPPKCGVCGGAGVIAGHTVHIPIDVRPGTTSMTVRRFRGKGHDGVRGGLAGELIVTVLVQEHRLFHREGLNLHMVLPIQISTALLGGIVYVPTLHGLKPLLVPPCVRNGQRITMDGEGVCLDNSDNLIKDTEKRVATASTQEERQRGHLYVHLLVVIPRREDLTGSQKALLENFATELKSDVPGEEEETPSTLKRRFCNWFTNGS